MKSYVLVAFTATKKDPFYALWATELVALITLGKALFIGWPFLRHNKQ